MRYFGIFDGYFRQAARHISRRPAGVHPNGWGGNAIADGNVLRVIAQYLRRQRARADATPTCAALQRLAWARSSASLADDLMESIGELLAVPSWQGEPLPPLLWRRLGAKGLRGAIEAVERWLTPPDEALLPRFAAPRARGELGNELSKLEEIAESGEESTPVDDGQQLEAFFSKRARKRDKRSKRKGKARKEGGAKA